MGECGSKMSNSKVEIKKLKESKDWTMWKMQVKIVLRSMEVFKIVDGSEKCPKLKLNATTAEITAHELSLQAWDLKDVKAQSVIITSIDSQPSLHVVNCKTSCEMWAKLHSVYEQKSETGIHLLYQRLFTFGKSADDDMANFISKLEEIVHQLKDLGETISDKMVMTNNNRSKVNRVHSLRRNLANFKGRIKVKHANAIIAAAHHI